MTEEQSKKLDAEIAQIIATSINLNAQTEKMRQETLLYPVVVTATATLALVAVVKLFL